MATTMTFNGVCSNTKNIGGITWISRQVYPDTAERTKAIPGRIGMLDFGRDILRRIIQVGMYIQGSASDRADWLRGIASWLGTEEPKTLSFSDDSDKYYLARLTGPLLDDTVADLTRITATFICPDPHVYSTVTKSSSPNGGNTNTPVRIVATMIANSDHLQVNLNAQFVRINYGFHAGDIVTIDTAQGWADINGLDCRKYITHDSDFYMLLPVGAFTLTADKATLVITYRERWF